MPKEPREYPFVLEVPADGVERRRVDRFDLYCPAPASGPLPAVVFVHGAGAVGRRVRPRDWPVFQGYGRLAAHCGLAGVVVDLAGFDWPFTDATCWSGPARQLAEGVTEVRARPEVHSRRIALWAFSGGALLVAGWLGRSTPWLRCAALSYPVLYAATDPPVDPYDGLVPHCPTILTRVGRENPERLATVDRFLADTAGDHVERLDVHTGRHGFDCLDDNDESRTAITTAMAFVHRHLTST